LTGQCSRHRGVGQKSSFLSLVPEGVGGNGRDVQTSTPPEGGKKISVRQKLDRQNRSPLGNGQEKWRGRRVMWQGEGQESKKEEQDPASYLLKREKTIRPNPNFCC